MLTATFAWNGAHAYGRAPALRMVGGVNGDPIGNMHGMRLLTLMCQAAVMI